jgi:cytochrome P450
MTTRCTNPFAPDFRASAFAEYRRMHEEGPVTRVVLDDGQVFWLVTGYREAVRVLKDHQRFGNDIAGALTPDELAGFTAQSGRELSDQEHRRMVELGPVVDRHLLGQDPPRHSRLRRLVSQRFTPRYVDGLRPRIEAHAAELLGDVLARAELTGRRETDLVEAFARPLPTITLERMLGLPASRRQEFRRWSDAVMTQEHGRRWDRTMVAEMTEFVDCLRDLWEDRRRRPADDLTSELIRVDAGGEALDQDELVSIVYILIVAGYETSTNLIGNGVLMLLEHPDQLELLRARPELVEGAVEEILRFQGAVEMSLVRWTREDTELAGGHLARRGDAVVVALAAANRDPGQFPDPDRFDVTRELTRHLGFGAGVHACLGAPLARLETQIALTALLARMPDLELACAARDLRWRPGSLLRGLAALPVAF